MMYILHYVLCRVTTAPAFLPTFFDGGYRKNSGPGGSGSVIIKINIPTHDTSVLWVASMAYGHPSTPNNIAEYWGLVHGLRQVSACGYYPLHVVGDISLVISQIRTYSSPLKHHLAILYREARTCVDAIGVVSWGHYYRDYNNMADQVENISMNTCSSVQVSAPSDRREIARLRLILRTTLFTR